MQRIPHYLHRKRPVIVNQIYYPQRDPQGQGAI